MGLTAALMNALNFSTDADLYGIQCLSVVNLECFFASSESFLISLPHSLPILFRLLRFLASIPGQTHFPRDILSFSFVQTGPLEGIWQGLSFQLAPFVTVKPDSADSKFYMYKPERAKRNQNELITIIVNNVRNILSFTPCLIFLWVLGWGGCGRGEHQFKCFALFAFLVH